MGKKIILPTVHYNFNGNTNDLAGNLNGTLYGASSITGDKLNISNNTSYMASLDPTNIASVESGAITVMAKIRISTWLLYNWIANKRDYNSTINNGKAEWQFYFDNRKLVFLFWDSSKNIQTFIAARSKLQYNINTDYHVAATHSGGAGDFFKLYINGELIEYDYITNGTYEQMRNSGSALRLGLPGWDTIYYNLNGSMDNFRLYKKELTAYQIAYLFHKGL